MNLPSSLINPALRLTQDTLAKAFEPATAQLNLQGVFSEGFDFAGATSWLKIEAQQNFPNFPAVEILPSSQINNALGGYAAENNTIYLAAELVEQNQSNPKVISQIILEEYGHYLDAWFNSVDTPGDEGALFAHYVQNRQLSPAELSTIQDENDLATITIGKKEIEIEQANLGDNPAFDLIGLTRLRNDAQFTGIDGTGFSVAVIDTGLDTDHPLLEANYLAGYDFIDNDNNPSDRKEHGTHITGTIGATDETIGVATDVGLISLRALDREGDASLDKIAVALEWVLDNQAEYNITAVNLSLGGGFFTSESQLSQSSLAAEFGRIQLNIQNLEAAGVTVIAAAGNNYFSNQDRSSQGNIAFPAISSTIAVGAVWRDGAVPRANWQDGSIDYSTGSDRIPGFSQRLDTDNLIFAPGAIITSTIPGGGTGENAGTSQAVPHVAGSVALLQEASVRFNGRTLTPTEVNEILRSTADTIIDGDDEDDNVDNTNLAYLRINVYGAIAEIKRRSEDDSSQEDSSDIEITNSNDAIAGSMAISAIDGSAISPIRETIGRDGTVNRSNDVDLYNFQLESPGSVRIEVASDLISPDNFDSYLRLFDASGIEIAVNDDIDLTTGNTFSRIEADLESGTYYIGVSGFRNNSYDPNIVSSGGTGATGNYALKFSLNSEDDGVLLTDTEDLNFNDSFQTEDNTVFHFTQRELGTNFYTTSIRERDYIRDNMSQYNFQGEAFKSTSEGDSAIDAQAVYRFFNSGTGAHLYTISESERDYIQDNLSSYSAEGIAYYGYENEQPGTVPLYRLYDSETGTHLFTASIAERDLALSSFPDRRLEGNNGIAFYVESFDNI